MSFFIQPHRTEAQTATEEGATATTPDSPTPKARSKLTKRPLTVIRASFDVFHRFDAKVTDSSSNRTQSVIDTGSISSFVWWTRQNVNLLRWHIHLFICSFRQNHHSKPISRQKPIDFLTKPQNTQRLNFTGFGGREIDKQSSRFRILHTLCNSPYIGRIRVVARCRDCRKIIEFRKSKSEHDTLQRRTTIPIDEISEYGDERDKMLAST